jgi:mono/diheme cytochrome c family protein
MVVGLPSYPSLQVDTIVQVGQFLARRINNALRASPLGLFWSACPSWQHPGAAMLSRLADAIERTTSTGSSPLRNYILMRTSKVHSKKTSLVGALIMSASASVLAGNWNVPTHAKSLQNPVARSPDTEAQGKRIYSQRCVSCHGEEAAGDGTHAKVEYDLRDIIAELSDGELFWKITHGVGRMPSYAGSLSDSERWLMVNHLRLLGEARAASRSVKPQK